MDNKMKKLFEEIEIQEHLKRLYDPKSQIKKATVSFKGVFRVKAQIFFKISIKKLQNLKFLFYIVRTFAVRRYFSNYFLLNAE